MRLFKGSQRTRTTVLGALISISLLSQGAVGASEQDHRDDVTTVAAEATGTTTINATSESYELTGTFSNGELLLRLNRKPEGSPVVNASIDLTIDGETVNARPIGEGDYIHRTKAMKKGGETEVIIVIKEGEKSDLLIGTLRQEQGHGDTDGHDDHTDHDEHEQHDDRDEHGEHDDHGEEGVVKLTPELMREFDVTTMQAGPGVIARSITRPAEVSFDMDRFTHVVPRVAGIAKSISASQGDTVKLGQVLAVLDSRELAELKAEYLAARERLELAEDNFERARSLRVKGITSEKTFTTDRTALAEAKIAMRNAKQKLNSIGIDDDVLAAIAREPDAIITLYTLRAPMGGMIIRRHLVQGELVTSEREAFTIADTSSVWINISLYSSDLPTISAGQHVTLETENGHTAEGAISFVSPEVSEETRTATARVVLKGNSQTFRPGMFIKAKIEFAKEEVSVRIPKSALQSQEGEEVVFVNEAGEFRLRPVKIGQRNGRYVEIIAGLNAGEVIAAKGAFLIKSQLSKASFDDGHNH